MIAGMNYDIFWRGILIGFSIAAPVGPIGILCIRRTLAGGRWSGFFTGLGAASADAIYGGIAAGGLTAISSVLIGTQIWIKLLGGVYLCYLGARMGLSKPEREGVNVTPDPIGKAGAYLSALFLTLSNPATIVMFLGVFAGIQSDVAFDKNLQMVAGVFCGSMIWWLLLSQSVGLFHGRMTSSTAQWINSLSGVLIGCFGLATLVSLFHVGA